MGSDAGNVPDLPAFSGFCAFVHLIRVHIKGMDHDADRKLFPVPVHDASPGRMPFYLFRNLGHSPFSQLRSADDLYPQQPDRHQQKGSQDDISYQHQPFPAVSQRKFRLFHRKGLPLLPEDTTRSRPSSTGGSPAAIRSSIISRAHSLRYTETTRPRANILASRDVPP